MAVWSIIKKSETEGSSRIDAEYYQPKYLFIETNIQKFSFGYKSLKEIGAKVVSGPFGSSLKSESYLNEGVPFIRISDLYNFFIRKDNLVYISELDNQRLHSSQLQEGDLVLSKVGNTIGVVSIITNDVGRANISENNIGIKLQRLEYGVKIFLLTFLNSKLGQEQILRRISGNAQPKLNIADIYGISFYNPTENVLRIVENLVVNAKKCVDDSNILYSQAEQILIEELGLKNLDLKDDLFYTTTLKEVKDNNRMDTEYYMPKYDYILKAIEKKGYNRLDSISKFSKILLKKKSEIFYKYIEIGGIDVSTGDVSYKEMQGCELPTNAKLKLSGGELIISKVRPTRGAMAIVPDYLTNNCLCSGAFSIFKIKSPVREYIQVFLRSEIGKVLLGHASTGTQYPTITDEDVKAIPIPDLLKNVMENISNKVFNAHVKRESAKQLLEQAKHKVEEMIEKETGVK